MFWVFFFFNLLLKCFFPWRSMWMRCSETHTGHGYEFEPNQCQVRFRPTFITWWLGPETWLMKYCDTGYSVKFFSLLMNHKGVVSSFIWTCDHSGMWIWFFLIPQLGVSCFQLLFTPIIIHTSYFFQVDLETPVHPHQTAPGFEPRTLLLWG